MSHTLRERLKPSTLSEPDIQRALRQLTLEEREAVALITGTMVQYYGEEVTAVRAAEEQAALQAMPPGIAIERLNGVNIGCGDRPIHPSLLGVDAHKGEWALGDPSAGTFTSLAHLRGWARELPFKEESIDFIVALHVLEHEPDPIATVLHWLDVVKPGGGIGIIVPDWRYTWDARRDRHPWSHRWNPTPSLLETLYKRHWSHVATLEHLATYEYKLSFDVVLRKRGEFVPFDEHAMDHRPTGHDLHERGEFLSADAA